MSSNPIVGHQSGIYRRFLQIFLLQCLLGVVAIASFVAYVDPEGEIERNWKILQGALQDGHEYHRMAEFKEAKPSAFVIGTSRSGYLPAQSSCAAAGQKDIFNFNLEGPSMVDIRNAIARSLAIGGVAKVVLGLDFFPFNKNYRSPERVRVGFASRPTRFMHGLKGLALAFVDIDQIRKAIRKSKRKISAASISKAPARDDFAKPLKPKKSHPRPAGAAKTNPFHTRFRQMEKHILQLWFPNGTAFALSDRFFRNSNQLDAFEDILEMVSANGVRLYLYLSPVHARLLTAVHFSGLWDEYEEWKSSLVYIVEAHLRQFPNTQIEGPWDFNAFNSVTTEAVPRAPKGEMMYYYEGSHFSRTTGGMILDQLFGCYDAGQVNGVRVDGYAAVVNGEGLQSRLRDMRQGLDAYLKSNERDVAEVRETVRRYFGFVPVEASLSTPEQ